MHILQTTSFQKAVNKLHANQKKDLDIAVKAIRKNPVIGDKKVSDLSDVYIYKFKIAKQLKLLAYTYEARSKTLILLAIGSHENFYRDLKKSYKA